MSVFFKWLVKWLAIGPSSGSSSRSLVRKPSGSCTRNKIQWEGGRQGGRGRSESGKRLQAGRGGGGHTNTLPFIVFLVMIMCQMCYFFTAVCCCSILAWSFPIQSACLARRHLMAGVCLFSPALHFSQHQPCVSTTLVHAHLFKRSPFSWRHFSHFIF